MDENKIIAADNMYQLICKAMDDNKFKYEKDEAKRSVHFGVIGNDKPMSFAMFVDGERELLRIFCFLDSKFQIDKLVDGAIACCVASFSITDGSFDYDVTSGEITFRMSYSYKDSEIGVESIVYMLEQALNAVDKCNDRIADLCDGKSTITEYIKLF